MAIKKASKVTAIFVLGWVMLLFFSWLYGHGTDAKEIAERVQEMFWGTTALVALSIFVFVWFFHSTES